MPSVVKENKSMNELINVIGLGYIGLPTALMLSSKGLNVVGTDSDKKKVKMLQDGRLSFQEDGLEQLFDKAVKNGIRFTSEYESADIYIIAVPTPFNKQSKKVVVDYLISAVQSIKDKFSEETIIVVESTISPGTIDTFIRPIINDTHMLNKKIHLVHAPERIIPGQMINELIHNNRIIGADNIQVAKKIKDIYSMFCKGDIELTDIKTAEMSKVAENAYRDINIAYANELLKICKEANI